MRLRRKVSSQKLCNYELHVSQYHFSVITYSDSHRRSLRSLDSAVEINWDLIDIEPLWLNPKLFMDLWNAFMRILRSIVGDPVALHSCLLHMCVLVIIGVFRSELLFSLSLLSLLALALLAEKHFYNS